MEHFYTLQGEGKHAGKAAYFIRLAGCDVGCPWCDVKESWSIEGHPVLTIDEIVEQVKINNAPIAVITGGEPLIWDLTTITNRLQKEGIKTHIETSGAHPISGSWNWVCLSPKRFKKALPETIEKADELKVVICHKNDFRWAENYANQVNANCTLYLQPEWSKEKEIVPLIVEYIKANSNWQISLQVHKYMDIP